jgi:hypothetical protein
VHVLQGDELEVAGDDLEDVDLLKKMPIWSITRSPSPPRSPPSRPGERRSSRAPGSVRGRQRRFEVAEVAEEGVGLHLLQVVQGDALAVAGDDLKMSIWSITRMMFTP